MGIKFFLGQLWSKLNTISTVMLTLTTVLALILLTSLLSFITTPSQWLSTLQLVMAIVAIILALIVVWKLNNHIRNLQKLTQAATVLEQGNLNAHTSINSHDELGQLADTFNLLAKRIATLIDDLETETENTQIRLVKTIESMSEGFSLYDTHGRLRLFNSKYRHIYNPIAHQIKAGVKFETIIQTAIQQGIYVDALTNPTQWTHQRLTYHHNPHGIFEEQLADGRWIQTNEYKTKQGDTFGIHTDITAHKKAQTALRHQNNYLQVLHEITIDLLGHLDLTELLEDIINRTGELLNTPHGYIYLIQPGYDEIERKIGAGIFGQQQTQGFRLKPNQGVAGKVWQTGHPLIINNFQDWPEKSIYHKAIHSIAAVPLKSGKQTVGVIGMAYDKEANKSFENDEVELLHRFAQLAAIALDNARLYTTAQEEKKRSDNLLNVVIPIGVALSAEQNFDRLLERMLFEAKLFCNADAGTLYLRTDNDYLDFVIVQNNSLNIIMGGTSHKPINFPSVPLYNQETGQPNHSNVAAHVALTGNATNIPDAYMAEGFNFSGTREFDQNTGYRSTSFLTIPLKNTYDYVVGVLQLINAMEQDSGQIIPFSRSLEQTAASLSSLATVAVEAYVREQTLRQQIQQLKIEIDEVKHKKQVSDIIETDFFQDLQIKARNIRRRSKSGQHSKESSQETNL